MQTVRNRCANGGSDGTAVVRKPSSGLQPAGTGGRQQRLAADDLGPPFMMAAAKPDDQLVIDLVGNVVDARPEWPHGVTSKFPRQDGFQIGEYLDSHSSKS